MTSTTKPAKNCPDDKPYTPPRWRIDLSLPPKDRYRDIARYYKDDVQDLTGLFESLLSDVAIPARWIPIVTRLSRIMLRKLHDKSQTEELRGISEESGVPMYLLVAFNVILDLLMGCTSGGVRSLERNKPFDEAKMLHFRTLDWSMEPLRRIIVQLDFVRSASIHPRQVLATSITYVGFTGVLTGVRPGLSMSLNFRGLHDNSTRTAQFRFYMHHLLVLLGMRPSIATYLRRYLTGDHEASEITRKSPRVLVEETQSTTERLKGKQLADVYQDISSHHTTAAYLIFCDGDSTMSVEKDFRTAKVRQSRDFIATTNHDIMDHSGGHKENILASKAVQQASRGVAGFDEFLDDSMDRHKCISDRWKRFVARRLKGTLRTDQSVTVEELAARTALTRKQVIDWVTKYPTTNESTHFTAVMNPRSGTVEWCQAFPQPIGDEYQLDLEL